MRQGFEPGRVGDRHQQELLSFEQFGMLDEMVGELLEQGRAGGFIAVDGRENQRDIRPVAQRPALDGAALNRAPEQKTAAIFKKAVA